MSLRYYISKALRGQRTDLFYIGKIGGVDWYRPFEIGDTIAARYLKYSELSEQYDKLSIKHEDLLICAKGILESLRTNNISRATEYSSALLGYIELEMSNDMLFNIVNCFVLIEDEKIGEINPNYTQKKRILYDKNEDVRLFFCEFWKDLHKKDENWSEYTIKYLRSRLAEMTETNFLRLIKMEKSQEDKNK